MWASDITFITKILQMCCRKKWNSNTFLHKNLYPCKKIQLKFFMTTNLKQGQIFDIWPKKG